MKSHLKLGLASALIVILAGIAIMLAPRVHRRIAVRPSHASSADTSVVAKIVVKNDGTLFFDGAQTQLGQLATLLRPIQEKRGIVWYFAGEPPLDKRGATNMDVHPVARKATDLALSMGFPIKRFSKEDFSEYIDLDGVARENRIKTPSQTAPLELRP